MKKIMLLLVFGLYMEVVQAQTDSLQMFMDSLEARFNYQEGEITFENGVGTLHVPAGFGYLDNKQSRFVLEDMWGNPEDTTIMGMLVPRNRAIVSDSAWAFIIT